MYKLLIVDDDKIIRQNMIQLIDWENSPFELCGESHNGEDALKKIRSGQVDLVITDVMMPVMDGISLISQAHQEYPDIVFVVLSNYDDFSYVKNALKIGAMDYLLKFENTKESVGELLQHAAHEIDRRKDKKRQQIREDIHQKEIYLERMIGYHLGGLEQNSPLPEEFLKNIRGLFVGIRCQDGRNTLRQSMEELATLLKMPSHKLCFAGGKKEQYLFLNYSAQTSLREAVMELMQQLNWNSSLWKSRQYFLAVESEMTNREQFFQKLYHCQRMLDTAFYEPGVRLISARNFIDFSHKDLLDSYLSILSNSIKLLQKGKKEEVIEQISNLCFQLEKDRLEPEQSRFILEHFLHEINNLCISFEISLSEELSEQLVPARFLDHFWSLKEIRSEFIQLVRSLDFESGFQKCEVSNQMVANALEYMKKHYREPISLQEAADAAGVSKTHLCRLFKQHLESSYHRILNDIRIGRAKQLLVNTDMSIQEISEQVGFSDYRYFKKVFIDTTEMFPTEYRFQNQ